MERELEPYQRVERSIQKKFRKSIWVPFAADIYTAKRSRSAATRSHLDIISVTLWKPL